MQDGTTSQKSSTSNHRLAYRLPSGIKPSNFTKIHRQDQPISGAFVIDRNMKFPDRKGLWHLDLATGYRAGSINADIFTVPPSASEAEKRRKEHTIIVISSAKMSVNFRSPPSIDRKRQKKAILLSLPRSFRGHAEIRSKVTFSPDMFANFTLFSEEEGVTKGFVGDFDHTQWKGIDQWEGDMFYWQPSNKVSSTLTLHYDDEDV
ncbi:hypothetical protein CPB83DRAFT_899674 [Crepidotus variabilis]|uniref:DUF7330 domain-containing protein n=1 Tax=Crepidotus variabilis TaxID=179855 RepID=A0A9P6E4G7_9AGAR|nr:hypothetical protein CPB83DRAFT_899674 [Crepidotus variabilis]